MNHIAEDRDGNLWFSTVGQGIFKYNVSKHYLERYEFKDADGLMASVLIDSEIKYGLLLIGETRLFLS